MNISKLRSKRVVLPTAAAVALLAVGGPVWAATADDDLQGGERDRVASAATKAVGGGTATDVETSDDRGEAYEVEVRTEGGAEVDVALDKDLEVVSKDTDDRDEDGDRDDARDGDDRTLGAKERSSAEKAARDAVGGGTVTDVEASDDRGEAYEVEVRTKGGTEWDVSLDDSFEVVHKTEDH